MSPSKWLGLIAASLAGAVAVACSSSSSSPPPPDAGGSSSSGSSGGSSSSGSSSSSSGGVASDGGGDSGSCQASVTVFTPPAYVAAVGNQGVCSASDISAFVAACGSNGSQTMCDNWQNANIMMEGGAGTTCGNCVIAPMNNGGTWTDPNGYFQPNYAGCVQLTDSTSGTMCAGALNGRLGCEGVACDSCSNAAYQACVTSADSTGCGQYLSAYNSACMAELADGGAVSTCTPGAASMNSDVDLTYVVTLICGGGDGGAPMDGGVTDAGGGG
jgi:hypothetical protein